jgi:hypothetical protein
MSFYAEKNRPLFQRVRGFFCALAFSVLLLLPSVGKSSPTLGLPFLPLAPTSENEDPVSKEVEFGESQVAALAPRSDRKASRKKSRNGLITCLSHQFPTNCFRSHRGTSSSFLVTLPRHQANGLGVPLRC